MDTPINIESIWKCIGHNPTEWALGTPEGDGIKNICALVHRLDDGRWQWEIPPWGFASRGIEPSRETAIQASSLALIQNR